MSFRGIEIDIDLLPTLHVNGIERFKSLILFCFVSFYLRYGIYPLTAFGAKRPPLTRPRAISPETAESVKSVTPEPIDVESRKVVNMMCSVKPRDDGAELLVSLSIKSEDYFQIDVEYYSE